MSKIICDVCGTAYPDTADQCPICGCARSGGNQPAVDMPDGAQAGEERTYTPVKGGRYSAANVRKRNQTARAAAPKAERQAPRNGSNRGLVILAVILALAIVAVLAYIGIQYFPEKLGLSGKKPTGTTNSTTTAPVETTAAPALECTELKLSDTAIELKEEGQAYLLSATPTPANTTDTVTYASADPAIATVNARGKIVAVAPGQTVITVTCGTVQKTCRISCTFKAAVTEPTTQPTEPSTAADDEKLALNREDITFSYQGEEWQLYDGSIGKTLLTWTSDDPSVATVNNGNVVAVGPGMTEVHAEYNGQKVSCIIRCSFSDEGGFHTGVGEG